MISNASITSDAPVPSVMAKQARRFENQYGDDKRQRDRQFQFIADAGDIGPGQIFEHADQEAADHSAERTGQSAEHRGGKPVDQHAAHHVRFQEHHRGDQDAGDRADRRRHAPAQRDHPAGVDANQPCRFRQRGGRAHGEADPGELKEQIEQDQEPHGDADHAGLMGGDQLAAEEGRGSERRRKLLDREVPGQPRDAVDDGEQGDETGDVGQNRRLGKRLEQCALDGDAAGERERQCQQEGPPVRHPPLHQLPGDEGREHRHFALGEIEVVDRLVDHDHGERHAGIDRAGGDASQDLVDEKFHGCVPQ
jgi:hypothetical protein